VDSGVSDVDAAPWARREGVAVRVLVTGGTGYIGSHQVVVLLDAGHDVHVVDDLSNSSIEVVDRIAALTGRRPGFSPLDLRRHDELLDVLRHVEPQCIIHFAASKHVGESMASPLDYYDNNLRSLLGLLTAARTAGVRKIVYSSSGSVYGNATRMPIPEDEPHRPTNPYSASKSIGERMLEDLCRADAEWRVVALRYFNPAGAHPSGLIGEDPTGALSNLLPVLMHVAVGNLSGVTIFGDDFDTPDGFGVRDYVHVDDVARAHLAALHVLDESTGFRAFNIGRGQGVSVLELIRTVERVTGRPIPRTIGPRRPGDVAALYADTRRAATELGLDRYADLETICADAWRWQVNNPKGYRS
jgi:UDP-glucose 4-epimerase